MKNFQDVFPDTVYSG